MYAFLAKFVSQYTPKYNKTTIMKMQSKTYYSSLIKDPLQ